MKPVILADNQDITRAGIRFILSFMHYEGIILESSDKQSLISALNMHPNAIVIIDYTLFDFSGTEELLIIGERFFNVNWIIFSEDLSENFIKLIGIEQNFSIVLKSCNNAGIKSSIQMALNNRKYLCPYINTIIPACNTEQSPDEIILTATEKEILKLIAHGLSVKEIAAERFSSIHTIITHKKNIFRKLEINNIYEATKYALRAGLIDSAEYFI